MCGSTLSRRHTREVSISTSYKDFGYLSTYVGLGTPLFGLLCLIFSVLWISTSATKSQLKNGRAGGLTFPNDKSLTELCERWALVILIKPGDVSLQKRVQYCVPLNVWAKTLALWLFVMIVRDEAGF